MGGRFALLFGTAIAAAGLTACSFDHGNELADSVDASTGDATSSGCHSFSSQLDTCVITPSDMSLTLTGNHTYDTTQGKLLAGSTAVAITRMQLAGKAGPLEVLVVDDLHMTANAQLRV